MQQTSSQGRKIYTAPTVADSFLNDNQEVVYVLESGATTLQSQYDALWNPPKGIVNMKGRGLNPDHRRQLK